MLAACGSQWLTWVFRGHVLFVLACVGIETVAVGNFFVAFVSLPSLLFLESIAASATPYCLVASLLSMAAAGLLVTRPSPGGWPFGGQEKTIFCIRASAIAVAVLSLSPPCYFYVAHTGWVPRIGSSMFFGVHAVLLAAFAFVSVLLLLKHASRLAGSVPDLGLAARLKSMARGFSIFATAFALALTGTFLSRLFPSSFVAQGCAIALALSACALIVQCFFLCILAVRHVRVLRKTLMESSRLDE